MKIYSDEIFVEHSFTFCSLIITVDTSAFNFKNIVVAASHKLHLLQIGL